MLEVLDCVLPELVKVAFNFLVIYIHGHVDLNLVVLLKRLMVIVGLLSLLVILEVFSFLLNVSLYESVTMLVGPVDDIMIEIQ